MQWERIEIYWENGGYSVLYRNDLERLKQFEPVLDALKNAQEMKDRLNFLLNENDERKNTK